MLGFKWKPTTTHHLYTKRILHEMMDDRQGDTFVFFLCISKVYNKNSFNLSAELTDWILCRIGACLFVVRSARHEVRLGSTFDSAWGDALCLAIVQFPNIYSKLWKSPYVRHRWWITLFYFYLLQRIKAYNCAIFMRLPWK